jgi:hypothetical protein
MAQPAEDYAVDANVVIDELIAHIGRLAKENAILRARVNTSAHTITADEPAS